MKTLICQIAWMTDYTGSKEDDKVNSIVHKYFGDIEESFEKENFLNINNNYYGFAATKLEDGELLPLAVEDEENVRVIWVAENHKTSNMELVGWYSDATVFSEYIEQNSRFYNIEVKAKDAVLLSKEDRKITCNFLREIFEANNLGYTLIAEENSSVEIEEFKNIIDDYIREGKFNKVNKVYDENDFDKVSELQFTSLEECFFTTRQLLDEENLMGIISILNKIILTFPNSREVYEEKAYVLYLMNQYDMALHNLNIANKLDKKSLRTYTLMADIYYSIDDIENALKSCKAYFRTIMENNYDVDAELVIEMFKLQIFALCDLEEFDEALEILEKALEICPDDEELLEIKEQL
ncbi:hypothetical protein SAMN02745196_01559 [Clostridium collagenovorans DSM 3089]|uniref:Uncharacterized protein n=1 Tax=Clostridium collagenovorans DSM 3089 TaxID=1121306 RepID=A0A1M5W5D8_9CLOT|nr:hypothetical protein [Clostridium collagenovorans]SHH82648.1 hypothetical protein SAMN02745196_01559 [Clostridium collagenovorans DSM 3089]